MEKMQTYYTAGELAEMFNLPKQTLLYYDKIDLLKPEFVSKNNYRHYTETQYMILEIIVNLRKLDISINDIKDFLRDRNPHRLQELLASRQQQLEKQIAQAEIAQAKIAQMFDKVSHASNSSTGLFTLQNYPGRHILCTNISGIKDGKELISIYAKRNITAWDSTSVNDGGTGWIIKKDLYLGKGQGIPYAYFTLVDGGTGEAESELLPAGLYLSADIKGIFYHHGRHFAERFAAFLERNQLEAISDVYCLPIKDHWMTSDPDEYINRVFVHVRYKNKEL